MKSLPAKAHANISSVELGKWKLVIKTSTQLNENPGKMNKSVSPLREGKNPCLLKADSKVRVTVVPTAIIR